MKFHWRVALISTVDLYLRRRRLFQSVLPRPIVANDRSESQQQWRKRLLIRRTKTSIPHSKRLSRLALPRPTVASDLPRSQRRRWRRPFILRTRTSIFLPRKPFQPSGHRT
ncbi:hypothetical protein ACFX2H_022624 [Malus domestica]